MSFYKDVYPNKENSKVLFVQPDRYQNNFV